MKKLFVSILLSVLFVQTVFAEGYYYFYDHLGNVDVVTDETGEAVATYDYDPFGNTIEENIYDEDFENDYKYTGQEEDSETGLYYYNARYYSPVLGRFMSQDPAVYDDRLFDMLGDPQSLNQYSYARNNPVKYVDPSGEEATVIVRDPEMGNKSDFGHTAIEINGKVYEFYSSRPLKSMVIPQKGILNISDNIDEFINSYIDNGYKDTFYSITIDTTDEQNNSMIDFFDTLIKDTPDYTLLGVNCTTIVESTLEYADIADFSGWRDMGTKGFSYYESRPITPTGLKSRLGILNNRREIDILNITRLQESESDY